MARPRRFAPRRPFPPYAYLGPPQAHPRNDPRGHAFGAPDAPPPPLDPDRWRKSEDYLYGIDLFNHGYYWEAHEAWEGLWIAAGKRGAVSEFLKGLIKLTAAGVKARQGVPEGVEKHAERARRHFSETRKALGSDRFAGFGFEDLDGFAREVGRRARDLPVRAGKGPAVIFDRPLEPRDG